MVFDITYFGYGVGLIMLGWIVGICVRIIMNIAGMVGNLSILFALLFLAVPVQSEALISTVNGCPPNADVELTLGMSGINSIKSFVISTEVADRTISVGNSPAVFLSKIKGVSNAAGVANIRWSDTGITLNTKTCSVLPASTDSKSVSLLLGGVCGMAFALAVGSRI